MAGRLACAVAGPAGEGLTVTADVAASLRRFRRAGSAAVAPFEALPGLTVRRLERSVRCPVQVARVAGALLGASMTGSAEGGAVAFWRAANDRAQAQAVAAEIERLLGREGVDPGDVAVIVPEVSARARRSRSPSRSGPYRTG